MRRVLTILLSLVACCAFWLLANGDINYRYWFDDQDDTVTVSSVPDGASQHNFDVSGLKAGLHTINIQLVDNDVPMSPVISKFFVRAADYSTVRYWIDQDEKHVTISHIGDLEIDVSSVAPGLHTLNVQICDATGLPSSVISKFFVRAAENSIELNYWFDHDFDNRKVARSDNDTYMIDVRGLSTGIHTLNVVAKNNSLSSAYSALFLKVDNLDDEVTVLTEIDQKPFSVAKVRAHQGEILLPIDVNSLPLGLHTLGVKAYKEVRGISPTFTSMFLRVPTTAELEDLKCYYSFDDFALGFKEVAATSAGFFNFKADVSDERLAAEEEHEIHCVLAGDDGIISQIYTAPFFKAEIHPLEFDPLPVDNLNVTDTETKVSFDWVAPDLTEIWEKTREEFPDIEDAALPHVKGYNVYRDGTVLNEALISQLHYEDSNFDVMKSRQYEVTVVYTSGEESSPTQYLSMHKLPTPIISYEDDLLCMACDDPAAVIYYAIGGEVPDESSIMYSEPFALTDNRVIKAVAYAQDCFTSNIATYHPDQAICQMAEVKYDGRFIALECKEDNAEIYYTVNGDDPTMESALYKEPFDVGGITTVKVIVTKTDFNDSQISTYRTPLYFDGVTAWIEDATAFDSEMINDYSTLAAIVWLADNHVPEEVIARINNPNLLVYVKSAELAPENVVNVVIDGYADQIMLVESPGHGDFFSPQPFRAAKVRYSRNFDQLTPLGGSSGWEAITMPFDVQRIMHGDREIRPFAALPKGDYGQYKPFWLMKMGDSGFVPTSRIEANVPYVISMPNNPEYAEAYILSGEVSFESEDIDLPATEHMRVAYGNKEFVGSTSHVAAHDTIYALNIHVPFDSYDEGSVFVSSLRDVRPFEAYMTSTDALRAPISIAHMMADAEIGAIDSASTDGLWGVYALDGVLYITTGVREYIEIYMLNGMLAYSGMIDPGINSIFDLGPGVYIVKDKKVMIR